MAHGGMPANGCDRQVWRMCGCCVDKLWEFWSVSGEHKNVAVKGGAHQADGKFPWSRGRLFRNLFKIPGDLGGSCTTPWEKLEVAIAEVGTGFLGQTRRD